LIWKIVIGRMTSEVVENTCESSFGEAQVICALNGPEVAVHRPQVRRNICNWVDIYRG
jgi:ribonuclease PH